MIYLFIISVYGISSNLNGVPYNSDMLPDIEVFLQSSLVILFPGSLPWHQIVAHFRLYALDFGHTLLHFHPTTITFSHSSSWWFLIHIKLFLFIYPLSCHKNLLLFHLYYFGYISLILNSHYPCAIHPFYYYCWCLYIYISNIETCIN